MPKICYVPKDFREGALGVIDRANAICQEYAAQGFTLTLRQLYYQFVARGLIPNRDTEYKRLGGIINDARLAGLIDWNYLEDRTRNVRALGHWADPADIISSAAYGYRTDKWAGQPYRPEVWIEKDALVGVIEGVCEANDVPFFSCRGYTSQSEVWGASQRMLRHLRGDQIPVVLHLGDHDPSGIDMTRDVTDRLRIFLEHDFGEDVDVKRLALNMDQVQQYNPPPNPAKMTDSRFLGYVDIHGDQSWELDALDPPVIAALIQDAIDSIKDHDAWEEAVESEAKERELLKSATDRWSDVATYLAGEDADEESEDELEDE